MPGSLIRELASERPNSRSRVPGLSPRKRGADAVLATPISNNSIGVQLCPIRSNNGSRPRTSLYRLLRFHVRHSSVLDTRGTIRFLPLHKAGSKLNQRQRHFFQEAFVVTNCCCELMPVAGS